MEANRMNEITMDAMEVMYVEAPNGPMGAKAAFDALEKRLSGMKGRKFYGTFQPPDGPYRACVVKVAGDDAAVLGLTAWTIPGGRYAKRTLKDWPAHIPQIGEGFMEMAKEAAERYDDSRPSIEFYRTETECILLLPIR